MFEDLSQYQADFVNYCRTGNNSNLDVVSLERAKVYRHLACNTIRESLAFSFPSTASFLGHIEWSLLCESFFGFTVLNEQIVGTIPPRFLLYIEEHEQKLLLKWPWLLEQMSFEWKKIECYFGIDIEWSPGLTIDCLVEPWNLNPTLKLMRFTFPVHQLPPERMNQNDKGVHYVILFREYDTLQVKSQEINSELATLFLLMMEEPKRPFTELLPEIDKELNIEDLSSLKDRISNYFSEHRDLGTTR